MTTHPLDTTVSLRMQLYRLQVDLADTKTRLAGTEDRLREAEGTAEEWHRLYRELWEQQMEWEERDG